MGEAASAARDGAWMATFGLVPAPARVVLSHSPSASLLPATAGFPLPGPHGFTPGAGWSLWPCWPRMASEEGRTLGVAPRLPSCCQRPLKQLAGGTAHSPGSFTFYPFFFVLFFCIAFLTRPPWARRPAPLPHSCCPGIAPPSEMLALCVGPDSTFKRNQTKTG